VNYEPGRNSFILCALLFHSYLSLCGAAGGGGGGGGGVGGGGAEECL
jgi:hypothetical protein